MLSFSSDVKDELLSIRDQRPSARRAELSALLHVTGSLSITGGKLSLVIHTENPGVARRVIALAHGMYDIQTEIRMAKGHRLQKKSAYSVAITGAVVDILRDALLRGGRRKADSAGTAHSQAAGAFGSRGAGRFSGARF